MYRSATTHSEKQIRRNFRVAIAVRRESRRQHFGGSAFAVLRLNDTSYCKTVGSPRFGSAAIPYVVRSTIGRLSDS